MHTEGQIPITWNQEFTNLDFVLVPPYGNQYSMLSHDMLNRTDGMYHCSRHNLLNFLNIDNHWPWLDNLALKIHLLQPGCIVGYHKDHYLKYKSLFNVQDTDIQRIIIFLEDWKPGHLFGYLDRMIMDWKSGDWTSWQADTAHMFGNLGFEPRYTLQITGTIRRNF